MDYVDELEKKNTWFHGIWKDCLKNDIPKINLIFISIEEIKSVFF